MLGEPQNPRFFSSKSRKGKSKPKLKLNGPIPKIKSQPASGSPPSPFRPPPLPPIPRDAFPRYSSTSSTPLPPPSMPSMPTKSLLRRSAPFLIAAAAAYVFFRSSTKESSEKHEEVKMVSSIPVTSIESPVAERTAQ